MYVLPFGLSKNNNNDKLWAGGRHDIPAPVTLTFDLLTLKVVSKSRVTWATPVPILVFLGLSVLDLGLMHTTDRQTSDSANNKIIIITSCAASAGGRHNMPRPVQVDL